MIRESNRTVIVAEIHFVRHQQTESLFSGLKIAIEIELFPNSSCYWIVFSSSCQASDFTFNTTHIIRTNEQGKAKTVLYENIHSINEIYQKRAP